MPESQKRKATPIPKELEFVDEKKQEYEDQLRKYEQQSKELEQNQQTNQQTSNSNNNDAWIGWVLLLGILIVLALYLLGYLN